MKKAEILLNDLSCSCPSCLNKTLQEIKSIDYVEQVRIDKTTNTLVIFTSTDDVANLQDEISKKSSLITKEANFCSVTDVH